MNKARGFIMALIITLFVTGCSDKNTLADESGNNMFSYNYISNQIPEGREIIVCFSNKSDYYDIMPLSITKQGADISDDTYSFTMYQNFPVSFTDEIKTYYSIDDLDEELGETLIYGESDDTVAMLFHGQRLYTLIYKKNQSFGKVDFNLNCIPISFFVDKEKIYVFSKEENVSILKTSLVITEIDTDKETQKQYNVPLSAMGLECLDDTINHDNIFVIDNTLFFSFSHFRRNITLAACDLETMKGTHYTLSDIRNKDEDGRLFVKGDKIGLMVKERDLSTKINWFDFDREKMKISENRVQTVDLESINGKKYGMSIFGYNFYYIDGCLCGIVYEDENQNNSIAYVEIDANTGDILTCVAIENENSQYKPWNYLIRDNEAGYQRFSIN